MSARSTLRAAHWSPFSTPFSYTKGCRVLSAYFAGNKHHYRAVWVVVGGAGAPGANWGLCTSSCPQVHSPPAWYSPLVGTSRKDTHLMTKTKSTHRLTAQRKLALYLATRAPDAPVGELLREYGLHL